jgi:hypothetical protein
MFACEWDAADYLTRLRIVIKSTAPRSATGPGAKETELHPYSFLPPALPAISNNSGSLKRIVAMSYS